MVKALNYVPFYPFLRNDNRLFQARRLDGLLRLLNVRVTKSFYIFLSGKRGPLCTCPPTFLACIYYSNVRR
jgi:hypothetical protein